MSKKIFRTIGKVAGVVAGVALIGSGIGSVLGGTMILSAFGATVAAGTIATIAGAVSLGASLLGKPKAVAMNNAALDRLNASINPRAPHMMVFGRTAMATEIRDQEFTGNDKEYLHRFFVVASHKVNSVQQIWFDDKLAWTSTGGVQGEFAGYLTVAVRTEGTPGNAINISSRMGSSRRFTGLAYVHLRYKLTGNSKKTESPFAQQVPTRMTIVGEGIPCYDPRQDSTVPGGSGSHRANNQATWTYGVHARNPACQLATWLLGWRIQNPATSAWLLIVGKGTPADRIDWASFIEAANLCDEPVAKLAGGTEPRYRGDGIVTEADDPMQVLEAFKACMNADLDDQDGLLRITVFHNDLAMPDADLGDDDIEGAYTWIQTPSLAESFNVVRGGYIEPSERSLYQQAEYSEARLPSPDGIDRIHPADFSLVQSKSQAERLAKQRLQRQQYGGTFRATFLATGWKVQKNSVVRLTCGSQGWSNKLFRVVETAVQFDGLVPMVLREEHPAIYAWDKEEGPAPQIAEPTYYAPGEAPIPQFLGTIEEGATVGAPPGTPVGDRPAEQVISELDQLEIDMAAAEAALSTAQADLATAQAELATAQADLDAAEAAILAAQGDITTLFNTTSGTNDAMREARAQAQASLDQIAAALVQAQADLSRQREIMRDAGITVDPATGQVRLYAFDVADERLNQVDIKLDAVSAEILLKASTTYVNSYVDQKITEAVLDPSQIADLDELYARMSAAELELDGLDAAIQLRATLVEVTGIEARVTTAESDIDALAGLVSTKVGTTEFNALDTRVSSAETQLAAIDGASITEALRTARLLANNADEQDAATLGAILAGDAAKRDQVASIAEARRELTVKITDDVTAETRAREALAVRVGAAEANIVNESLARIAQDNVFAGQISSLSASLGSVTATVGTQGTAIAGLDSSLASLSSTVSAMGATVSSQGTAISNLQGDYASLSSTVSTQGSTISSHGTSITTLQGNYASLSSTVTALGSDLDTVEAAVSTNATAISNLSGDFASLSSTVSALGSTVSTQASAISTLGSEVASLDSTVSTQGVTVSQHQAAITTAQGNITTLFGRAGVRVDVNGRVTGWETNNNGTVGDFIIHADHFAIEKPGGGDGLTWTTDSSGRGTLRVKSGAVNVIELGWVP